jgi:hypothetical protein
MQRKQILMQRKQYLFTTKQYLMQHKQLLLHVHNRKIRDLFDHAWGGHYLHTFREDSKPFRVGPDPAQTDQTDIQRPRCDIFDRLLTEVRRVNIKLNIKLEIERRLTRFLQLDQWRVLISNELATLPRHAQNGLLVLEHVIDHRLVDGLEHANELIDQSFFVLARLRGRQTQEELEFSSLEPIASTEGGRKAAGLQHNLFPVKREVDQLHAVRSGLGVGVAE